jgi:hypothetical protein
VGVLVVDCKIRLLTSDCLLIVLEKLVLVDAEGRKVVPTANVSVVSVSCCIGCCTTRI